MTRVAVATAGRAACGTPTPAEAAALAVRWVDSGRNPLLTLGSTLALACPPEGLAAP